MNNIEQLIKKFCPEGVKWVKLGDVCDVKRGVRVVRKDLLEVGTIPVYQNSLKPLGYFHTSNQKKNTTYVIGAGNAGEIGFSNVDFWSADDCYVLINNENFNSKYIYYFLLQNQAFFKSKVRKGSVPRLAREVIENIKVPLPPLEVQQSIVDVLDKFEAIRNNLNAELALRRKQYEHYREKLLTFGDDVERVKVCDFCELRAGKSINASELSDDNEYWCYGGNGTRGKVNFYSHSGEYAIIGRQGALCGCVSWATGNFYATEHAVVVTPKKNVNSRFLFHLFTFSNLNQYKSQGAQPGLAVSKLNELIFQIPNYATQQSIVSKLDKFEALISNIERELELRTKQYEYYREKLLTF